MDRIALHSFMVGHRYGVVSSISGDGTPQSALVGIAISQDLEIIFDTVEVFPEISQSHSHGQIALLSWDGLEKQTVQFEGLASEANGPDLKRCQEIYFSSLAGGASAFEMAGTSPILWCDPDGIRYSDYDQTPAVIEEVAFGF